MVKYNLVHITCNGEYMTPLVASQLFDQAECQAIQKNSNAPENVEAWVIDNVREYFKNTSKNKLIDLKNRCPHINIRMIPGIGRLKYFPIVELMRYYRNKINNDYPVIYHCRSEVAANWALKLKPYFPNDKVVLDVRGYWPAEYLYTKGIEYPELAQGDDKETYNTQLAFLKKIISQVDGVTTVSNALRKLLIDACGATEDSIVVPCCVNTINNGSNRERIRAEWGIANDECVVVYSGTTAKYQHLDDLTIPFMKKMAEANHKIKLAFFSSQLDKIKVLLEDAGVSMDKVLLKSFKQHEVADALSACDAGILIRKPTLVNAVANPVKIAEYLAAGLPIIIEKGVGGVSDEMFEKNILHGIEISKDIDATNENDVINWLYSKEKKNADVRAYVKQVYLWESAIHVSRGLYQKMLNKEN